MQLGGEDAGTETNELVTTGRRRRGREDGKDRRE